MDRAALVARVKPVQATGPDRTRGRRGDVVARSAGADLSGRSRAYRAMVRAPGAATGRKDQSRIAAGRQPGHRQGYAAVTAETCGRSVEFSGSRTAAGAGAVQRLSEVGGAANLGSARSRRREPLCFLQS